jgi:reactive intermediate/imine deaminase
MSRTVIATPLAPAAIGPYSQAIRVDRTVYLSGQLALDPTTGQLVDGGFEAQVLRAFANLEAVARASGGSLADGVKLTLFLTDLAHFSVVNTVMEQVFPKPFPARSTVGVASLPRGAQFEVEAVMVLPG